MTSLNNRLSPQGIKALLSVIVTNGSPGVGEFEGCTFKAMILADGNTLSDTDKWEAVATLDDATYTLAEYTGGDPAGSRRIDCTSISVDAISSPNVDVKIAAPLWTLLADIGAGSRPTHVLFYVELAAVAANLVAFGDLVTTSSGNLKHRVPLAIMDAVFIPDGSDFQPAVPSSGIFTIRTDGC